MRTLLFTRKNKGTKPSTLSVPDLVPYFLHADDMYLEAFASHFLRLWFESIFWLILKNSIKLWTICMKTNAIRLRMNWCKSGVE